MAYKPICFSLLVLISSAFSASSRYFCFASEENPSSLVLGLRSSRTDLPARKASPYRRRKTMEMQAMVEPLREARDGYLMSLNIGTPSQVIEVYLDTGSDLTWVPCGNLSFDCMDCDDYRNYKPNAAFSPTYSSSTLRDSCFSHVCIDVHSSDNPYDPCIIAGCSLSNILKDTCAWPCPSFAYTYGAGGIVAGTLTRDTLRVHSTNPNVIREVPKFAFGCVGSTYREPIGLAGFGRGSLSLPSQLGFLQKGFSHCFLAFKYANNPNISSPLVMGDVAIAPRGGLQFTPMLKSPIYPNYYYIGLEGIAVGNASVTTVPNNLREFDSQGNGCLLIDSGTTYTHLPEPFFSQLLSILESAIIYPRAKEVEARSGFDLCYKVPCPNNTDPMNDDLPTITFYFLNNVSLVLPHGNSFYAMGAPINSSVVKCLLFQRMDDGDGPAGVFGSFQQQNVEVVYDLENGRVGFQPMDCALAASAKGLLHKG